MRAIIIALGLVCLGNYSAQARTHPDPGGYLAIDVAARPSYAIETIAPLRRGWRHHTERNVRHHQRTNTANKIRPRHQGGGAVHVGIARSAPITPKPLRDALALATGALVGIAEGFEDGLATALPVATHAPSRLRGVLEVGELRVDYGSGGEGWALDYGDYEITPDDVGPWGSRHGAIGIAHDEIWDVRLRRYREGIELHAATNDSLKTEGCVAIERQQWAAVKRAVLAMIDEAGHAFLRVGPNGARIEPDRNPIVILASAEPVEERHERRHYAEHRYHERHRRYASR